jgi:hypothetical protein
MKESDSTKNFPIERIPKIRNFLHEKTTLWSSRLSQKDNRICWGGGSNPSLWKRWSRSSSKKRKCRIKTSTWRISSTITQLILRTSKMPSTTPTNGKTTFHREATNPQLTLNHKNNKSLNLVKKVKNSKTENRNRKSHKRTRNSLFRTMRRYCMMGSRWASANGLQMTATTARWHSART